MPRRCPRCFQTRQIGHRRTDGPIELALISTNRGRLAWSGDRRTPESGAAQLLPVRPQRFGLGRLGHRDLRIEVPRALLMMFPGRDIFVPPQRRHPHIRCRDGRHTSIFMGIARLEVLAQPRHQLLKLPMLPERPSLRRRKESMLDGVPCDARLALGVRGPVDREALRRLASILRGLRAIGRRQIIEVGEAGEAGIATGHAAIAVFLLG